MERSLTFTQALITEASSGDYFRKVAIAQKAYDDQLEVDGGEHISGGPADYLHTYLSSHKSMYNQSVPEKHRFEDHYDPNKPNMGNPHIFYGSRFKRGQVNQVEVDRLRAQAKEKGLHSPDD